MKVPCLLLSQTLLLCEGSGGKEKPRIRANDHIPALLINSTDSCSVKQNLKVSTPAEKSGLGEERSWESFTKLGMKENL